MVVQVDQLVQSSVQPYYWWYAYGHFDPGENGFPHIGQVIRHYREMLNMDIEELARRLGVSARRAYELEETVAMPKSISRRQAVADILGIPVALMNLPTQLLVQPHALQSIVQSTVHTGGSTAIHPDTMQAYEDVLDLAWGAFYTSSPQRSARTVDYWQKHLIQAIDNAHGISQDELKALYCRFLQLGSVIARDRRDVARASHEGDEAVALAFELTNAELIAASLYRRAKIYVERKQYDLAVKDAEAALPYAKRSRDPLRCYVSIFLAEVYSLHAPTDVQLRRTSLTLLDEVGRTVRARGTLEGDGSFAKVDLPGLYMIRGDVLRRQGKVEQAQDALSVVRDSLPPEFTRWHGNLLISEAQVAYADHDVDGAAILALDALSITSATQSLSNKEKIVVLFEQLRQEDPHQISVRNLGKRLGFL